VEVLVALAIALLLARLAIPAFRDWIATQSMLNEARRLADSLHLARSEAIKSGYRVNVCKSRDRSHCTLAGGWDTGYIVYADTSRDGHVDPDELLVRVEGPAAPGVSIRANHPLDNYVSFTSLGYARLLNGALQMGTFTLCRDGQRAFQVVIANSGRVRIDKATGVCA
jgi:type IV fimbrial biogenesis protein FimT